MLYLIVQKKDVIATTKEIIESALVIVVISIKPKEIKNIHFLHRVTRWFSEIAHTTSGIFQAKSMPVAFQLCVFLSCILNDKTMKSLNVIFNSAQCSKIYMQHTLEIP